MPTRPYLNPQRLWPAPTNHYTFDSRPDSLSELQVRGAVTPGADGGTACQIAEGCYRQERTFCGRMSLASVAIAKRNAPCRLYGLSELIQFWKQRKDIINKGSFL
jgi:hypothetical protein